ncbi:hypothetical protein LXL04_012831 [Taraxacum kok-saghyz]
MSSGKFFQCEGLAKTNWTRDEEMEFVNALITVPEEMEGSWQLIANAVPGKTAEEVMIRPRELLNDLDLIELRQMELPKDPFDSDGIIVIPSSAPDQSTPRKGVKKKGIPWTEEEHRKFLEGLAAYGKGDWRSISRISVVTRSPAQVASHAQKYFLRQSAQKKDKKRASIHDITTAEPLPLTNIGSHQVGGGGGGGRGAPPPPPLPQSRQGCGDSGGGGGGGGGRGAPPQPPQSRQGGGGGGGGGRGRGAPPPPPPQNEYGHRIIFRYPTFV